MKRISSRHLPTLPVTLPLLFTTVLRLTPSSDSEFLNCPRTDSSFYNHRSLTDAQIEAEREAEAEMS